MAFSTGTISINRLSSAERLPKSSEIAAMKPASLSRTICRSLSRRARRSASVGAGPPRVSERCRSNSRCIRSASPVAAAFDNGVGVSIVRVPLPERRFAAYRPAGAAHSLENRIPEATNMFGSGLASVW